MAEECRGRTYEDDIKLELLKHHLELRVHARTSTKDFAVAGINILFLLNGGAVVALATFLAAMLSGWTDKGLSVEIVRLCSHLFWFATGSALAGAAAIAAYLTYEMYLVGISNPIDILRWDASKPLSDGRRTGWYTAGALSSENPSMNKGYDEIEHADALLGRLNNALIANAFALAFAVGSSLSFIIGAFRISGELVAIGQKLASMSPP